MDVQNPTRNTMQQLAEKYHFHELSIEDSLSKIEIPKIDKYAGSAGLPASIIYDTSFIPAFLQSFILFSNSCLMSSSSLVVGDFRLFPCFYVQEREGYQSLFQIFLTSILHVLGLHQTFLTIMGNKDPFKK